MIGKRPDRQGPGPRQNIHHSPIANCKLIIIDRALWFSFVAIIATDGHIYVRVLGEIRAAFSFFFLAGHFFFCVLIRFVYNFHWPHHNYYYYYRAVPHTAHTQRSTGWLARCQTAAIKITVNFMAFDQCYGRFVSSSSFMPLWHRHDRVRRNDGAIAFIYSGKFCHYFNLLLAVMCLSCHHSCCDGNASRSDWREYARLIELELDGNIYIYLTLMFVTLWL